MVATVAGVAGVFSLGWQIKSKWWDRPNIVLSDVRVSAESVISGRMTGGEPLRVRVS